MSKNRLLASEFIDFLKKINDNKTHAKQNYDAFKEIQQTIDNRKYVTGEVFYEVILKLHLDINIITKDLFSKKGEKKMSFIGEQDNKFRDFISPFTIEMKEIAKIMDAIPSRATKLKTGESKVLYPHEVYGLAIAFGLKPSQLFDYFYGDAERPIVGL